ncbi:MAG: GntR family transcriptional regulator [Variibacter sp.]
MASAKPRRAAGKSRRSLAAARLRPQRPTTANASGAATFALVDKVYGEIREAIREGVMRPGHRLVERDIAANLNVSRTPVREALRLLEAHGLASSVSGRSLVVTSLTPGEIAELYFAWEHLEGLAAATAAQNATDLEIDAIRQIHALWNESESARNLGRLNKRLHLTIHVATHNSFLMRVLRTIDDSVSLLGFSTYSLPGRAAEVAAEHGAVVDAIARRAPEEAAAAARKHIRRAGQLRMAGGVDLGESAAANPNVRMLRAGRH